MDLVPVTTAIYDRLKADSGSGGLFHASGVLYPDYLTAIYGPVTVPDHAYVVMTVDGANADPAFTLDTWEWVIGFHIYDAVANGPATCNTIINRIWGDSALGSAPTYGLHRWTPTLSGATWTPTALMGDAGTLNQTDKDVQEYILTFRMHTSR